MRITTTRGFDGLHFSPESLQGFVDTTVPFFRNQSDVSRSIETSFDARSGDFADVASLLAEPNIP